MWSAIKRFFSWLFSSCLGGKKPKQGMSETSLLHNAAAEQDDSDHDDMVSAYLSSSTSGINAALATDSTEPAAAVGKIVRQPSEPALLTAHQKLVVIQAARCGSNVYIDALDENMQAQAADALMSEVQTSFNAITANIETIKQIAKQQEQTNYSQLSHAEQLSTSWKSMSRDILSARNANEKSIDYRCNELLAHASDNMIHRLVSEIKSIFATCKSILAANVFKKLAHSSNLQNANPLSEDSATTSEGQFFNNANRKTRAILDRFNQNSENVDASLAHQSSPNL